MHRHHKSHLTTPEHSEPDSECCSKPGAGGHEQFDTPSTDFQDILSDSMHPHLICSTCELSVSASGSVALNYSGVHNEMEVV